MSLSRIALIGLWILSLALLQIAPGRVPVSRTQEARVLETARQMLASPDYHGYLAPMLDGHYRLQKPPLAYWLAALSFKLFGISAAAGRIPAILAGWGTLAITYLAGRWLFNQRTGLLASLCLLSSYLFYRYTRLAETDTLANFFVTASCLFFWKASAPVFAGLEAKGLTSNKARLFYFHVAAAFAAGAALSKGPPAAFPILFFLSLCLVNRDWTSLKKLLTSGCLLTFAVFALAWYGYLASNHLLTQVFHEIDDLTSGHDHGGTFLNYLPELLSSTAPWSAFFVAALVFAIQRFKIEPRLRGLLLWSAAIFLPLCCVGNKQFHYLFPLMPPAMLLVAALFDHVIALPPRDPAARPIAILLLATLITLAAVGGALPVAGKIALHQLRGRDFLFGGIFFLTALLLLAYYRFSGLRRSLPLCAMALCLPMCLTLSLWMPALVTDDFRVFATDLRAHFSPGTPYVFYGEFPKLPLNFELQQQTPYVFTRVALDKLLDQSPSTVVLKAVKHGSSAPKTPPGVQLEFSLLGREQDLYVYRPEAK